MVRAPKAAAAPVKKRSSSSQAVAPAQTLALFPHRAKSSRSSSLADLENVEAAGPEVFAPTEAPTSFGREFQSSGGNGSKGFFTESVVESR